MKEVGTPASPVGRAPAMVPSGAQRRPPSLRRIGLLYAGLVVAGSIAIGLASGVAAAASPSPSPRGVTVAGRGANLFLTSCAACHGSQGAGTANGPDIRNAGQALADFVLRTGRMPLADPAAPMRRGTPAFSDADRAALVDFVASLGQGPTTPDVVTSGADLAAGRNLYVANCAACHGPGGGGGAVGGGFVAPALDQADATTIGEAVVSGPGPMPRFSFTPEQLNDLAGYVLYLRDAPHPGGATAPAVGPVTEGFIAGLTLLALLLTARWVAVRRAHDAVGAEPLPMSPDAAAQAGSGPVGDGE
jgi:ubiquinol-cytochrome c reductase cytochrome c subunit